jgi:hypothetical protein
VHSNHAVSDTFLVAQHQQQQLDHCVLGGAAGAHRECKRPG